MKEKIINSLRWALVLPVFIVALIATIAFVGFLHGNQFFTRFTLGTEMFNGIVPGCVAVIVGAYTAPKHKLITSYILESILAVVFAMATYKIVSTLEGQIAFESAIYNISFIVGGVIGCLYFKLKKQE